MRIFFLNSPNSRSSETEEEDDSDVEFVGSVNPETIDITNDEGLSKFMEDCEDESGGRKGPVKAKGELGIEELPPIEELSITVPESECIQLGTVSGFVETLGKSIRSFEWTLN